MTYFFDTGVGPRPALAKWIKWKNIRTSQNEGMKYALLGKLLTNSIDIYFHLHETLSLGIRRGKSNGVLI